MMPLFSIMHVQTLPYHLISFSRSLCAVPYCFCYNLPLPTLVDKPPIAIWDNRCTYHAPTGDAQGTRVGWRTVGVGEIPYLDPNSVSRTDYLAAAELAAHGKEQEISEEQVKRIAEAKIYGPVETKVGGTANGHIDGLVPGVKTNGMPEGQMNGNIINVN